MKRLLLILNPCSGKKRANRALAVSYTHLTLPTT